MNFLLDVHNLSFLKKTIESLRKEMVLVGIQEGLSSEKTIMISQKLDFFISKHQKIVDKR